MTCWIKWELRLILLLVLNDKKVAVCSNIVIWGCHTSRWDQDALRIAVCFKWGIVTESKSQWIFTAFARSTKINDDSAAASLGLVLGVDYKGQFQLFHHPVRSTVLKCLQDVLYFILNTQNSLLCISVDQGVVGEHEASMWTEQQSIAHIWHWRRFSGPPGKCTHRWEENLHLKS